MRIPRLAGGIACAGLLAAYASPASSAATPDSICASCCDPNLVVGQPPRWRLALGGLVGHNSRLDVPQGRFFIDAEDRMAMPQFGLLDMNLEGAVDFQPGGVGTAIGAYAKLPYVRVGIERDLDAGRFDILLSAQGSARRGGLFQHGERMRLDWSPTARRIQIGFMFNTPWTRYRATRPFGMTYNLPHGRPPAPIAADASRAAVDELARVEHSIDWLDRLLTPHLAPKGFDSDKARGVFVRGLDVLLEHQRQPGHDFAGEDSAYHAGLELAFAQAAGGDAALGRELARQAESVILDEVVVPFNRLFARTRRPAGVGGFSQLAQARFEGIVGERELDPPASAAVREVFRRVVVRIDMAARAGRGRWNDTSLVWLPLNYGLRPGQYDSQAEIEDVLGRLVGEPFTRTNAIRYVLNDQFYYQLRNTILQTRYYHVLWIHDFRGRNSHKGPDRVAWSQAIGGYIEALTEAVEAMDRGERDELPVFMVFLDQHYYEVNQSPRLMRFLEHLATAEPLELDDPVLRDHLALALTRLQAAVRTSPALRQRGADYVQRHVRVQVLITYPLDPAFAGDILMRDHRKLAFYDATERDPTAGGGLFTGEGVGEHYQGPLWEDRSLVIRGPEVLRLKTAARQLLLSQGFREDEIPQCLRKDPLAPAVATADAPDPPGWNAHLLTAINETGWGSKSATVMKAAIYNLMPGGSAMIAPDSLWTSDFWAGMFAAAALRGCRVYIIAPTSSNAPSNALPTMGLMHETLSVLFAAGQYMGPDLARLGGALHVGLYTRTSDVSDMRSQVEAVLAAAGRGPGMFPRLGLHPECIRALQAEADTLETQYTGPVHPFGIEEGGVEQGGRPKIHMKAQFFASAEGLGILGRREWGPILARYLAVRRRQTLAPDHDLESITTTLLAEQTAGAAATQDVYTTHCDSLRAVDSALGERVVFLATVGSHNQDRRSMLLDGEVLEAVSGSSALTMAIDFAFLVSTATWPQSGAELDAHFPETSSTTKQFFRWIKNLI